MEAFMASGRFAKDISGQRFGRWLALEKTEMDSQGHMGFLCRCDCGTEKVVKGYKLKRGDSLSCGCLRNELSSERERTHGLTKHPLFVVWCGMMNRCYSEKSPAFKDYGGRGITVCERWHSVENFVADNAPGYAPSLSLDRIDNDGSYTPENVRWADRKAQSRNRRSNVMLTYQGKTQTLFEWAAEVGIAPRTLWARIRERGWPVEKALTTPVV
jgi:hypothetical protein